MTFARAALLGVSNRGDPYSCIINYSKCPKDQSRLLYYLNNHRGGFFQYFDKKNYNNNNNNYNVYDNYRPVYYQNKYKKKNKIIFQNPTEFIKKLKKTAEIIGTYATKYTTYSPHFKFPDYVFNGFYDDREKYGRKYKPMVFPESRRDETTLNPRILTQNNKMKPYGHRSGGSGSSSNNNSNFFNSIRDSKTTLKDNNNKFFSFPEQETNRKKFGKFITDRLPVKFNFPSSEYGDDGGDYQHSINRSKSFFPES